MTAPRVNFTFTLTVDDKKRLDKYNAQTGIPIGEVLRRLTDEFFAGRIKTNALPPAKP